MAHCSRQCSDLHQAMRDPRNRPAMCAAQPETSWLQADGVSFPEMRQNPSTHRQTHCCRRNARAGKPSGATCNRLTEQHA